MRIPPYQRPQPSPEHKTKAEAEAAQHSNQRATEEETLRSKPHVIEFGNRAGAFFPAQSCDSQTLYGSKLGESANIYKPFNSEMEWSIARWAKLQGSSSTAFDELLAIPGVCILHIFVFDDS
jgi:hypothetical protein